MKTSGWDTLHVEDNEDDAFFVERAFKTAGISSRIARCRDGQSVVDYFEGADPYNDRETYPLPHVVILDLKLPLLSGLEVLGWLRTHPEFGNQIVIILTSSSEHCDVRKAHSLHVNAYLVKPSSLDGMVELAKNMQTCWLNDRLDSLSLRGGG